VTVPSDVSTLPAAQLLGAKQGHSQRYLYFWEQQDEPKFPCDQSPNEGKFRNLEAMLDKHEQVLANDDGSDILLAVMLARISTANGWSIQAQGRTKQESSKNTNN
jgi:hypothetical protein